MLISLDNEDMIIVRISGQGQYKINRDTQDKIDEIDDSIVDIFEQSGSTTVNQDAVKSKEGERELRDKLTRIVDIVTTDGTKVNDKEIVESNIIIPNPDISFENAKKIFRGEGII